MAVLLHFLFEVIKISILGLIYAPVIYFIWLLFLKVGKKRVVFDWKKLFIFYRVITMVMFVFLFTYYGNHGLGDDSYIPLGYGETMSEGDTFAYFVPKGKGNQIAIDKYLVKNDILCASVDSGFMVYYLKGKLQVNFNTESLYNSFATAHKLPLTIDFKTFELQYDEYWNGWRFWVMP